MSGMNAYRSRLSAKYWNRLPLAAPARRAMTFREPPENPCAPTSASAASMMAARRAGATRAHVTVGMPPPHLNDQWSFYCEGGHSQGARAGGFATNAPLAGHSGLAARLAGRSALRPG